MAAVSKSSQGNSIQEQGYKLLSQIFICQVRGWVTRWKQGAEQSNESDYRYRTKADKAQRGIVYFHFSGLLTFMRNFTYLGSYVGEVSTEWDQTKTMLKFGLENDGNWFKAKWGWFTKIKF